MSSAQEWQHSAETGEIVLTGDVTVGQRQRWAKDLERDRARTPVGTPITWELQYTQ